MSGIDALPPGPIPFGPWLLVLARLSGTAAMTPLFAAVPMTVRACLMAAAGAALTGLVTSAPAGTPPDTMPLVVAIPSEFALGAALGLGIQLALASMAVGARLLDVQIGYAMGQVLDPATQLQLPVLSAAFNRLALLLFVLMDGLHGVLRGLVLSFDGIPAGTPWPTDRAALILIHQLGAQFSLGFAMVAPMAACLLLTEIGLAAVARSAPQLNVFMLGLPVKIGIGLACLAAWLPGQLGLVARMHDTLFQGWEALFQ